MVSEVVITLNPLIAWEWEASLDNPSVDALLDYFAHHRSGRTYDAIKRRYLELKAYVIPPVIATTYRPILDNIIRPLRSAGANYALGNCVAAIAACGMVAEMMAILLWEMHNGESREFENSGQQQRLEQLVVAGVLDEKDRTEFETVRNLRNQYLHRLSTEKTHIDRDVRNAYRSCCSIVKSFLIQGVTRNRLDIYPPFEAYLKAHGQTMPPRSVPKLVLTRGRSVPIAWGNVIDAGFLVYVGSHGVLKSSQMPKWYYRYKKFALSQGAIEKDAHQHFKVMQNVGFRSATRAATFMLGYRANGLDKWKTEDGTPLRLLQVQDT